MEIKNRKSFNQLIKSLTEEILDEEDLEEITSTGDVDGYNTPFAFAGKKGKKNRKQIATNSTGYDIVNESLDDKDLKKIRMLIRQVVGNILRDIWLKRNTWVNRD